MTDPIWTGEQWIFRPYVNGVQKKYTSRIEGKRGANECRKKHSAALTGLRENTRFEKAWNEYLQDVADRLGKESESYRKSESIGRIHLMPRLKNHRLIDLTAQDWQTVINKAKPNRGGHETLSKKTCHNLRSEIMAFCRFATKSGYADALVSPLYTPRTAPTIGKAILQPEALKRLLADSSGDWYVNAWRLMAATGLRPGEVYGLQREDVKDSLITVRRSIRNDGTITQGKNKNAKRTLYQTQIVSQIVKDQISQLNQNSIGAAWLFADQYGRKPNPVVIAHHWEDYRTSDITLYGLRHTFVSMTKNDLPESMLKSMVGHSKSMDTLGVYGKAVDGDAEKAAKILDNVFNKIITLENVSETKTSTL